MTTPLPEAEQPAVPSSAIRVNPFARALRASRLALAGNTMARGIVLFIVLVVFTLLYALVLQWLSESGGGNVATQGNPPAHPARSLLFRAVDDGIAGPSDEHFVYSGPWQHMKNLHDGRSQGTSSRTYRIGATASLNFSGERIKIYGVKGPNGGYAELRIDGETYGLLRFYSPHKQTDALIYSSPLLSAGRHGIQIVVAEAPNGLPRRRFVNLDGAAYSPR